MNGRRWTDTEHERLIAMARDGDLFSTIAAALDRPVEDARSKYLELISAMSHAARRDTRRTRDINLKLPLQGFSLAGAEQLADRDARAMAAHHSVTAALLGDPLPGRSALDLKQGSVSP